MGDSEKRDIVKDILKLRLSQMLINERYKNNEFKIPIHLGLGHEAIAIAIDKIMSDNDQLILSHRNAHYNLARGKDLKGEVDEYLLKEEGLAQGKLGSMNLLNENKGIIYTSSILGNNLPVAAGLALGKKVKSEEGIVIVITGDGGIEEGAFYETLLFLKTNNLPCLIIIEDNGWSLATKIEERRYNLDIEKLVNSLSIKYQKLNSNDVFEYTKILRDLRKEAILGETPICIHTELTSLGSYYLKNEKNPYGKFINYHHGKAPTVDINNGSIIEKSYKDPIFILQNYFSEIEINDMSNQILNSLESELK